MRQALSHSHILWVTPSHLPRSEAAQGSQLRVTRDQGVAERLRAGQDAAPALPPPPPASPVYPRLSPSVTPITHLDPSLVRTPTAGLHWYFILEVGGGEVSGKLLSNKRMEG